MTKLRVTVNYYMGRRHDREVSEFHPGTDRHTAMCLAQKRVLDQLPSAYIVNVTCEDL